MKQQIFYIHGGGSFSNYDCFIEDLKTTPIRSLPSGEAMKKWSDTLAEDLGGGYEVFKPRMPNSNNARYEEWKIWFERHFEYLRDGVILIGWSLGGYFLAKYMIENSTPFKIKALFLLASPFENIPSDLSGEDGGDFAFDTSKVGELTKKANKIYLFHSKDDHVVLYDNVLKFKDELDDAELVSFSNKNHFIIEEFPELLSKIKELASK